VITMDIQRLTIIDKEQRKGIDATRVIHNGNMRTHVEELQPSDWGE